MIMKLIAVLLVTVLSPSLVFASQSAYEYIGLDLDTTAEAIRKGYPNSDFQISSETKSYYTRVSKRDVKGGVYMVHLYQHQEYWPKGVTGVQPKLTDFKWLKLSFEKRLLQNYFSEKAAQKSSHRNIFCGFMFFNETLFDIADVLKLLKESTNPHRLA